MYICVGCIPTSSPDLGVFVFQFQYQPTAQASYRSAVRMARDVVADIGEEAAAASGGLIELARISEHCSERDGHTLLAKKAGLRLPLPLTELQVGDLNFPVLELKEWGQFLADKHCLHALVGLARPNLQREEDILHSFWCQFESVYPRHQVFARFKAGLCNDRQTYPLLFHADEGRGRRRQAFLVSNFHSALGRGTQQQAKCTSYIRLRLNFEGSTLTTRMLHSACPKKLLQEPGVFNAVMENAAQNALHMINHGIVQSRTGRRIWFCVLNVCGDWPFLHKCGQLSRSFNNVPKKLSDPPRGICHRCKAGCEGIPWETIHEREPRWMQTIFSESAFSSLPPFCQLLHTPGEEEGLFAFDTFHAWHLGVGKSFTGSCLVLLSQHCEGSNVEARFQGLEQHFFHWCETHQESPSLIRLTRETVQWSSTSDFPQGGWFKGSATTVLCRYLEDILHAYSWDDEPMLQKAAEAVTAINECFRGLYTSNVFIPAADSVRIAENGLRFLRRMAWLAKEASRQGQNLWLLTPKAHILHHLFLEDMLVPGLADRTTINPLTFCCQQDEDFIGKVSRTSRKVDPRVVSKRCIQRFLKSAYDEYIRAKYIIKSS